MPDHRRGARRIGPAGDARLEQSHDLAHGLRAGATSFGNRRTDGGQQFVLAQGLRQIGLQQSQFGLLTKKTQRWNLNAADTLSVTIHCAEEGLREDEGLHGHLGFNLAINLFDGFKHYSYDTPIWLREGLAHMVEREIGPRFNSFDSAEGGIAQTTRKEKWEPEVRKLVAGAKAPRMAELMSMKEYSDLTLDRHYATWSMVQYLVKQKPAEFAKFCGAPLPDAKLDGIDLSSVFLGKPNAAGREVFWYYSGDELQAVRKGPWKLHVPHEYLTVAANPGRGGKPSNWGNLQPKSIQESGIRGIASRHGYRVESLPLSLFNLQTDLGETRNCAAEFPEIVSELQTVVAAARAELGDGPSAASAPGVRPAGDVRSKSSAQR